MGPPDDTITSTSRRRLLGTVAGSTAAGLAGCAQRIQLGGDDGGEPTDDAGTGVDTDVTASYPEDVQMFQATLRRQGNYPDERVPASVSVNWEFPTNVVGHTAAKSTPMPAVDGKRIVFAGDSGWIDAYNPAGRKQWATLTDATDLGFHGSPTIVGDTAYIAPS